MASRIEARSTLSHTDTTGASERTLFDCSRPMKCTATPARSRRVGLGQQLLGVVLPHHGAPGRGGRLHGVGAEPLGDGEQLDARTQPLAQRENPCGDEITVDRAHLRRRLTDGSWIRSAAVVRHRAVGGFRGR